jgi:hypothetical protein
MARDGNTKKPAGGQELPISFLNAVLPYMKQSLGEVASRRTSPGVSPGIAFCLGALLGKMLVRFAVFVNCISHTVLLHISDKTESICAPFLAIHLFQGIMRVPPLLSMQTFAVNSIKIKRTPGGFVLCGACCRCFLLVVRRTNS